MAAPHNLMQLQAMKEKGEKITCVTAYDASFAAQAVATNVDILLVGDSLGMVVQGQASTLSVTLDDMIYHSKLVRRGAPNTLIIIDLPFMTYATPTATLESAARLMREGLGNIVKVEGGSWLLQSIQMLTERGIPVCGHLGLTPQSVNQLGGYRVQGRSEIDAQRILNDALELEKAGISLLVLECIPSDLAKRITTALKIPTIGIGAGIDCDGQVLVLYDMLGITIGKSPIFSRNFLVGQNSIQSAFQNFVDAVKNKTFPAPEHSFD
jgi:3-methyl-2-oxobutanoate hydroxymethyltransferase